MVSLLLIIFSCFAGDIMTGAKCGAGDAHSSGTPDLTFGFCEGVFGACPIGFSLHGDSCYKVTGRMATWLDAKTTCDVLGGDLVVIESSIEEMYLENLLKRIHGNGTIHPENYWIDGSDLDTEGVFRWMGTHGHSMSITGYTNWAAGQPDNSGNKENCMEIRFSFGIKWNDYQCDAKQNFICEASPEWEGTDIIG